MAGAISTPELVAAAASAGALGFLAAGYKPVEAVAEQVAATRALGAGLYGVNLFVPGSEPVDLDAVRAYRERLLPLAERLGVTLPDPREDDDGYPAKVALVLDDPVPIVSFVFGCPSADVVARLRGVGTTTVATVTSPADVERAVAAGVDALVVQGPGAGGHRATFDAQVTPPDHPLPDLVASVRAVTELPLIASGGLTDPTTVRQALTYADAVQLGTAFLDADEAGTPPAYRAALHDPRYTETALTRAFSGRFARGLRNAFIDEFDAFAPAAYPAVNQLTGPLRRAAGIAGDAQQLSLWAGLEWRAARSGPTASILADYADSLSTCS